MRNRPKLHSPKLDMNPMVDMAFLLVTFFMLTTTFKTEQPVVIDPPASHSEVKLPETDIMTITVSNDGRIFFDIDGKFSRQKLLNLISSRYGVAFSDQERRAFSLLSGHGMQVGALPGFLDLDPKERRRVEQTGIPCDSLNNELKDWVVLSRVVNPRIRIAIQGDKDTPYPMVHNIINTLLDNDITRFNLITTLETEASPPPPVKKTASGIPKDG